MNTHLNTSVLQVNPSNDLDWTFPDQGDFTRIKVMAYFGKTWIYDGYDVLERIDQLQSGQEFAELFKDVVTHSHHKIGWAKHPEAFSHLRTYLLLCKCSWDQTLQFDEDGHWQSLVYLIKMLKQFTKLTRM